MPEAFFLPAAASGEGQRFCLYHPAQGRATKGLVIYIHPLAEEMNKSRRMAALQSRAFAQAGYAVLQIDLKGCGDSTGDFGDATWQSWVSDVVMGCQWLRAHGVKPANCSVPPALWLWGLRAGCLLAVEAAQQLGDPCHFLFWQAPTSGKALLQQFLRLKVAADMLGGVANGVMASLRQDLTSGLSVEVAGYRLSSALASGLEQARSAPPENLTDARQLLWFEVSPGEDTPLSPASIQTLNAWRQAGFGTHTCQVQGTAFWQSNEIEEVPALLVASITAITGMSAVPTPEVIAT